MKKIFVGLLLGFGAFAVILTITAARRAPTIRPNVSVAGIEVGGLTVEDAARKLRIWWEEEKLKPLKLHSDKVKVELPSMRPGELGVTLDDTASVAKLPEQDALADAKALVTHQEFREMTFDPIFKSNGMVPTLIDDLIQKAGGPVRPAKISFENGVIVRVPEVATETLDNAELLDAVSKALRTGTPVELPVVESPKRVPDDKLDQITDLVSEFHTHFPSRQYDRNANIKLASSRLNGIILMPGDQLSFNKTVGQRTIKQGFRLAGVYKNGKHDTGIGGGICQVSTTLYNASLYGDLKIVHRSNHSMPVAYVPLGRDATVDFGSLDLVVQNDYATPVAVCSEFKPGTLTFRILGKKEPDQWVKITQVGGKSWDRAVQVLHDSKLAPGAKVVVDKGSRGHSIRTYRLIYKGDTVVKKEPLGFSFYGGGDKIIAVGPDKPGFSIGKPLPLTKVRPAAVRTGTGG